MKFLCVLLCCQGSGELVAMLLVGGGGGACCCHGGRGPEGGGGGWLLGGGGGGGIMPIGGGSRPMEKKVNQQLIVCNTMQSFCFSIGCHEVKNLQTCGNSFFFLYFSNASLIFLCIPYNI